MQGDGAFAAVLENQGFHVERLGGMCIIRCASDDRPRGINADFNDFSDTFLSLAAIAPLMEGPTIITGIEHTRRQETDRIAAAAINLRKLGQEVIEKQDSIEIHPKPLKPARIETFDDHRIAMSFSILGCHDLTGDGEAWLEIENPECCAKTYPEFFTVLEGIRNQVHDL